jgi:hypothetical protein
MQSSKPRSTRAQYSRGGGVNQSMAATIVANPRKTDTRNAVVLYDIAESATHGNLPRARLAFVSLNTTTLCVPFDTI